MRHQRYRSVCSGYHGARGWVRRRAHLGVGVRCRPPRPSSWTHTSKGFRFAYSGRISAARRKKFFESLLCCGVSFGGLWALRKAAKAMCSLIGANHAFMLPHGELFINGSLQINTAPPQHAIFYRAGPRFNPKPQIASAVVKTTMAAPRCHADQKAQQSPPQCGDAPNLKAFDDLIPLLRAAIARFTPSRSNVMASMQPTKRLSLVVFAVQRKSVTDTLVRVIFTAPPVHSSLLLKPLIQNFTQLGILQASQILGLLA